jgi:hypothetical protein
MFSGGSGGIKVGETSAKSETGETRVYLVRETEGWNWSVWSISFSERTRPKRPNRRARAGGEKSHGVRKNLSCRFQRLALRDRYETDFDTLLQGRGDSIEHHQGVPFVVCVFQSADD